MSVVTNAILSFDIMEEEPDRIAEVNRYFDGHPWLGNGFVSADFDKESGGPGAAWYGGTKFLETPLYVGAFNCLPEQELLDHLRGVGWERPWNVQLMLKREDDDVFDAVFPCRSPYEDNDE